MVGFQGVTGGVGYNDTASDQDSRRRMQLAQLMLQSGNAVPAVGLGGALNKMLSGAIAGYQMGKDVEEQKDRADAKTNTLAEALRAGQGQAAETKSYGDGTTINWDERKGDANQMAAILASNRDTAPIGMQMQIGQMDEKRKNEAAATAAALQRQHAREDEFWKPIKTEDGSIIVPAMMPGFQMPGQAPAAPPAQAPVAPPAPGGGVDLRTARAAPNPPPVQREVEVPEMFQSVIGANAERTGLDPRLLGRVFMRESGGRPDVVSGQTVSSAGAQGPMQVMPGTQRDPGFGVAPARDGTAEENFRVGSDYLAAMSKKYGGNIQHALMAYNWGPGNVDAWLKSGADPSKVPAETRNYVAAIAPGGAQPPAAPPVQVADASGAIPQTATTDALPPGVLYRPQQGSNLFGGTGLPAQDSNLWIQFQTRLARGEKLTEPEQLAMELIRQRAEQPRTIQTDQGLVQVPGMPLPTLPGRQPAAAPAAPPAPAPAPATDTVPNPVQPPAPAAPPVATPPAQEPQFKVVVPKAAVKPSNEQNLNAGFANRLNMANSVFDSLESEGYVTPSLKDRAANQIPLVGGYLESENFQKQDQARREFINAQLRRESGASISDAEFDNANRQYFPQPGDSEAVLAQKRVSRDLAIANMAQSAGPAEINFKLKPPPKDGDKPATPTSILRFDAEGNIIQ